MPTDAVVPTPKWMETPQHGFYRKLSVNPKYMRIQRICGAVTFFTFIASFVAYADRRCLYVYQKHDPRKVSLPWQDAFNQKFNH